MKNKVPLMIIGLVAVAAIVGAVIYASMSGPPKKAVTGGNSASSNARANSSPPTFNTSAGAQPAWSKGTPNATVTIEEFADFECPACAMMQPALREVKTVYGDRVRVVFRQFPLAMHKHSSDAARAAEAAGMQGRFWEMHDMIFEKQKDWKVMPAPRDEFAKYAEQLGLDVEKFKTDMVGQVASNRVAADKKRGEDLRVGSTPSIYINGRLLLPEEMNTQSMRMAIEAALQGK